MTTWVPQSCTLPTAERPLRIAEFDTPFAERLTGIPGPSGYGRSWCSPAVRAQRSRCAI